MEPARFDIVLDFACWLHLSRQSRWRKLLFDLRALDEAELWEEGDSGGFVLHHETRLETLEQEAVRYLRPLIINRNPSVAAFRSKDPAGDKTWFADEVVEMCPVCSGFQKLSPQGYEYIPCPSCVFGRVYTYTKIHFRWRSYVDHEVVLNQNTDRQVTRELIDARFAAGEGIRLETLAVDKLANQIGLVNQRIQDTALKAAVMEKRLLERIEARGKAVFHERHLAYVPLSYLNIRLGKRYGQYFVTKSASGARRAHPRLPLCPWRLSFWGSAGTALLAAASMFTPLAALAPQAWLAFLPLLVATPLAARAYLRDQSKTQLWLISDDGDGQAWRACAAQAKRWALEGRAQVDDPYYITLLEDPSQAGVWRQSFRLSLTFKDGDVPSRLEWVYLSPQGLAAAGPELAALGRDASGLTWFSQKPAALLYTEIAENLARLGPAKRPYELRLVRPAGQVDDSLPRLEALLKQRDTPLRRMVDTDPALCLEPGPPQGSGELPRPKGSPKTPNGAINR